MVVEERALAPYERALPDFRPLDVYDAPEPDLYPDWLGTISAGYKDKDGKPVVSRDGTIYVVGTERAPGLVESLAEQGNRRLTITFPSDDPRMIVRQHFSAYTATKLLAYGNAGSIHVIEPNGHREVLAGTDEYDVWRAKCKVSTSILFCLSRWEGDEPVMFYPDGFGPYRIRTTSRNTVRSVLSALRATMAFTGGHVAGVPFEIMIDYRDVTGPQGDRRKVPVWAFAALKGATVNSRTLRGILSGAIAQGAVLRLLPAPNDPESIARADFAEFAEIDDDQSLRLEELQRGGACDPADYRARWFAMVRGSVLDSDEARAQFVAAYTTSRKLAPTSSLSELLKHSTDLEALDLLAAAEQHILDADAAQQVDPATGEILMSGEESDRQVALAAELFSDDGPAPTPQAAHDAALTGTAERARAWFRSRVPAEPSPTLSNVDQNVQGARLAEITGSLVAAIAVLRYLTGDRAKTFGQVTEAEAKLLDAMAAKASSAGVLADIVPIARQWLAAVAA